MRTRAAVVAIIGLLCAGCGVPQAVLGPSAEAEAAGRWERLPDPPLSGRTGATVVAVGDQLLVVGGWEFLCPPNADCSAPTVPMLRDGAMLDVSTQQWRPIADAPFGFHVADAVTLGDDAYVLTGCRGSVHCLEPLELLRYDATTDQWDELGTVPRPAPPYAALLAVGDRVLVLADSDENGEHPDHLYDPATGTWETLPEDPLPRVHSRFAVADGDRVLVFASTGTHGEPKEGVAYDLASRRWSAVPDAPGAGYQVWRNGDEAWLNPHFLSAEGGVLDLRTDEWHSFPAEPPGLGDDEATDLAGLIGGGRATFEYAAGWVRDTEHDVWLRIAERPSSAYDEVVTALGDALVVFGGQRWEDDRNGELVSETWIWRPDR
jgi:hypothetical protein